MLGWSGRHIFLCFCAGVDSACHTFFDLHTVSSAHKYCSLEGHLYRVAALRKNNLLRECLKKEISGQVLDTAFLILITYGKGKVPFLNLVVLVEGLLSTSLFVL